MKKGLLFLGVTILVLGVLALLFVIFCCMAQVMHRTVFITDGLCG